MAIDRLPLSIGYGRSRTGRLLLIVVGSAVLVVLWSVLGGMLGVGDATSRWPIVVFVAVGAAGLLGCAVLAVWMARLSAWLEPDTLTVRQLRTRSVRLSTATSVVLAARTRRVTGTPTKIPTLSVTGEDGGSVVLPLRNRLTELLPPDDLRALANALAVAPAPGGRQAVTWLLRAADDPRGLLM